MARRKQLKPLVTARAKVCLEIDEHYVFGLGICRILQAIDESGSIKHAATTVGKSYRHVWSRIKEVEQALGISLVDTQVGGVDSRRSSLTEPARQLVTHYDAMREQVLALVQSQFSEVMQRIVTEAVHSTTAGKAT